MRRNSPRHNNPTSKKLSGFTLIEILVAITIFTLLSFSAYQVLNQTQRANQQSIVFSERLKEVQRAIVMIDNDFRQIALEGFAQMVRKLQKKFSGGVKVYLIQMALVPFLSVQAGKTRNNTFPEGKLLRWGIVSGMKFWKESGGDILIHQLVRRV